MLAKTIHISGIVQGVGFRPFVYRLACGHGVLGWVLNAADGVHVHAEASAEALDAFIAGLSANAPAAARIASVQVADAAVTGASCFKIAGSDAQALGRTHISPDIATCPACLAELADQSDRRYHYPFINCTDCGPRFTIIEALPYDRKNTSMAGFAMCLSCASEYVEPADRRFHAQPDACFACGPALSLTQGGTRVQAGCLEESDELIARAAELLKSGGILAVKGIGGFHLACDATDEAAVARLRERKNRPHRPFALMVANLEAVEQLCEVNAEEAAVLTGSVRPVVLLMRRSCSVAGVTGSPARDRGDGMLCKNSQFCHSELESESQIAGQEIEGQASNDDLRVIAQPDGSLCDTPATQSHPPTCPPPPPCGIADAVAGPLHELGVMLPATPLHHLLLAAVGRPLVMTSANISGEPIIAEDSEAELRLANIADAFLSNNRPIVSRYDDSVVRIVAGKVQMIRRARGYAPAPVPLDAGKDAILAAGSEQKSTFCLVSGSDAFVSQHLGDLGNSHAFQNYLQTVSLYKRLFAIEPDVLACDAHPSYHASTWARESGDCLSVQHHHAHIAAVLAENGLGCDERVIGLALDGTGFGSDGSIWGGEVLLASQREFSRFACLEPAPMPGGEAAVWHPSRMAYAVLSHHGLLGHPGAAGLKQQLGNSVMAVLDKMLARRMNTPMTSSAGRLFDAVSAILGICADATYDGQPAMELEAALWRGVRNSAEWAQGRFGTEAGTDGLMGTGGRFIWSGQRDGRLCKNPQNRHPEIAEGKAQDLKLHVRRLGPETAMTKLRVITQPDGSSVPASVPNRTCAHLADSRAHVQLVAQHWLSPEPLLCDLLDGIADGVAVEALSLRFHAAVARLFCAACELARDESGIGKVALSGGVFMNRFIMTELPALLEASGFEVLTHRDLPANDGCIAYGQAAVAAARQS